MLYKKSSSHFGPNIFSKRSPAANERSLSVLLLNEVIFSILDSDKCSIESNDFSVKLSILYVYILIKGITPYTNEKRVDLLEKLFKD